MIDLTELENQINLDTDTGVIKNLLENEVEEGVTFNITPDKFSVLLPTQPLEEIVMPGKASLVLERLLNPEAEIESSESEDLSDDEFDSDDLEGEEFGDWAWENEISMTTPVIYKVDEPFEDRFLEASTWVRADSEDFSIEVYPMNIDYTVNYDLKLSGYVKLKTVLKISSSDALTPIDIRKIRNKLLEVPEEDSY